MRYSENDRLRKMQFDVENTFIRKAVNAIREGKTWDEFTSFGSGNSEWLLDSTWKEQYWNLYDKVGASYRNREKFDFDGEIAAVKARQDEFTHKLSEERYYQSVKDDLTDCAEKRMPWSQAKRRNGYTEDMEPLFRRAQREAGVSPLEEHEDQDEEMFKLGFMS